MNRSGAYGRLLKYLRPYLWPRVAAAVACMLIFSGTNGLLPFLVRDVLDGVFARKDLMTLTWIPAAVLVLFVVRGLANYGSSYLAEWVSQRVLTDLRDELNDHIQELPLSFFNRTPTGAIVSR